jgi:hypothetical protein
MRKVLIINHNHKQCGVWNYGMMTHKILTQSKQFIYHVLCVGDGELFYQSHHHICKEYCAIIFNWHPVTMPWLTDTLLSQIPIPKLIISGHDNQHVFSNCQHTFICDPTAINTNNSSGVSRPLLIFDDITYTPPNWLQPLQIGSFGFGQSHKMFPDLITKVSREFTEPVVVNIHMPHGDFVDPSGGQAAQISSQCEHACASHVTLNITHEYIPDYHDLIKWLNKNDINILCYENQPGRGCSSAIDAAIACMKPWACNKTTMFRHVLDHPGIALEDNTIKHIIAAGIQPSEYFLNKWSNKQFIGDHEIVIRNLVC